MWGTSLPDDKLAGDLGNVIGATLIGGRRSDLFTARNLGPGNLGLLQQYRHIAAQRRRSGTSAAGGSRRAARLEYLRRRSTEVIRNVRRGHRSWGSRNAARTSSRLATGAGAHDTLARPTHRRNCHQGSRLHMDRKRNHIRNQAEARRVAKLAHLAGEEMKHQVVCLEMHDGDVHLHNSSRGWSMCCLCSPRTAHIHASGRIGASTRSAVRREAETRLTAPRSPPARHPNFRLFRPAPK